MRSQLILIAGVLITVLFACKKDAIVTTIDPVVQEQKDSVIIADYIAQKGYKNVNTTTHGIWYTVLDSGRGGTPVKSGDILTFYYAGRLTDDFLFATNVDTIAMNNGTYDSAYTYSPIHYTYTPDAWNFPELYANYYQFESGYREGATKVLSLMTPGGHSRIIIPSLRAYSTNPPYNVGIPQNAVLVFDIYLTYKR